MTQDTSPNNSPTWIGRTFRFILRLLLVVIIGLGLGIGIYLGATYLANRYFQSVQVNADRISALEANQALSEEQTKGRIETLTSRLQVLEKANDSQNVAEADMESRLAVLETAQPTLSIALETLLETLNQQSDLSATLQSKVSSLQTTQQALVSDLKVLAQDSSSQDRAIQTLSVEWDGANQEITSALQDVEMLKAMEFLSMARINLYQNNYGLAQQNIASARTILLAVHTGASEEQSVTLAAVIARLDAALQQLPDSPVAASDEIEGAWFILATSGDQNILGMVTPVPSLTPDQAMTPSATPSPTPTPTP